MSATYGGMNSETRRKMIEFELEVCNKMSGGRIKLLQVRDDPEQGRVWEVVPNGGRTRLDDAEAAAFALGVQAGIVAEREAREEATA